MPEFLLFLFLLFRLFYCNELYFYKLLKFLHNMLSVTSGLFNAALS